MVQKVVYGSIFSKHSKQQRNKITFHNILYTSSMQQHELCDILNIFTFQRLFLIKSRNVHFVHVAIVKNYDFEKTNSKALLKPFQCISCF